MRNKKRILSAIDVGTTKVAAVTATADEQGSAFQVLGVGVALSRGLRKGMVTNIDEARAAVVEALTKAEQASGISIDWAYVGITGSHINSLNSRNAIAITRGDRLVQPHDLRRALETMRSVGIPKERELLHVIPREYTLDGNEGIRNPVGMHGFRLDADAHVVSASTSSVRNLIKCIRGAGVEVEDVVMEALASGEAVLRDDEKDAGVLVMDMGGGTTDVAVFKAGQIWHTFVLPVAGYQITRDLAIGLGIPFELAEQLKIKYGTMAGGSNGKDTSAESMVQVEDGHSILVQDLNEIIHSRIDEILRLIQAELPDSNLSELIPGGVVLTGGCAKLPGIDNVATDVFHCPVRIGLPQNVYGLADTLYDPAYATVVGLLSWGTRGEDASRPKRYPLPLVLRLAHRVRRTMLRK